MNKILKRSISLLLVLCTLVGYIVLPDVPAVQVEAETTTTTDTNVITNGTFETQLPDGTVQGNAAEWGYLSGIWSVVPEEGKENNYVVKVADTSASGGGYVYYCATVEPGEVYTFKIDYKGTYSSLYPTVILRKNSHAGASNNVHEKKNLVGETWQTYQTLVEVPADVTKLYILITTSSGAVGTAYFDNLSLVKGEHLDEEDETGPVGNLIANGVFEKQSAGSNAASTDGWGQLPQSKIWSVVSDPDKADNFLLKLDDPYDNSGDYIYYAFEAKAGYYKIKLNYKAENSLPILLRADTHTSSAEQVARLDLAGTNGKWVTYEATVEVPKGISSLYMLLTSGGASLNLAYFDNISFEKIVDDDQGGEGSGADYDIVLSDKNLLGNPYFELTMLQYCTPLDAATAPVGWTLETIGTGGKLFKSNVKAAYKGEWAIQLVDTSVMGGVKLYTKVENIQPGAEYTYLYARAGEDKVQMAVRYYNADGVMLQEYINARPAYEDWRESSQKALAPEGSSYAIVSVESTKTGKCNVYLDGLSFYLTADTKKTNLLPNTSFENYPESLQDVYISKTTEATTKGWKFRNAELVPAESEMDKAAVGNYMAKLVDATTTTGCDIIYTLDVDPGKNYTFSAMLRGEFTLGVPVLKVAYFQDEDCTIPAQMNGRNYMSFNSACSPDFWSRIGHTTTSPENAVKMQVSVLTYDATSVGWLYAGNLAVVESVNKKLDNLDFEDTDAAGALEGWESYEKGKVSASKNDPFAGKLSMQIKDNSQTAVQGAVSTMADLSGYQHAGIKTDQLIYTLTGRVKDTKNVKAQLTVVYYNNGLTEIARDTVTSNGSGKWQFLVMKTKNPDNAAYIKVLFTVGEKASATGTAYLDDVTFMGEYAQLRAEPYDWKIIEDEGNRLYFTEKELENIRKFALDDTVNAFGASGADAYRKLIKQADTYVAETEVWVGWEPGENNDRVTRYRVDLEHIQDMSADPLLDDVPGGRNWPYLESLSNTLYTRFSAVTLAYAITGDTKYSDQAISWAMDLCEWEYWCETKYCWPSKYNGTLDNPRLMRCAALVYDMCYDQLTQEQRDIIAQNIIYKGMIPLCMDFDHPERSRSSELAFTNKYMSRCIGIIISGAAIINEENKEEVGRYMDKAYAVCAAFINERYNTANNEGYSYTRVSTDDMLVAMDCARRVTGREGLLTHPYFSEVVVDWVVDFIAPESFDLPVFSDSYPSGFFKPTMLILNREMGNGKAGYFLQQVGMDSDPFNTLIYGAYEPVITEPTENDYVVFVERVGYGGLRTGWEDGELMFYIIGNESLMSHCQYDQLSFQISTNKLWPAADPGYSNLTEGFAEQEGHNTIIVDGVGQNVRGNGKLNQIVDAQLYGQFSGSAPDAYSEVDAAGKATGVSKLTQFDRHAIMINHSDRPYYIVIDELASEKERMFDFNLYTSGWDDITVDGKPYTEGVVKGNKVAIYGANGYIFTEFVSKNKLNIEAVTYEDGGPVLQADSGSGKSKQFMTILTKPYGFELDDSYSFPQLLNIPNVVQYKTSSPSSEIVKSVTVATTPLYFFRGHATGDWIEFPFVAPESGTFELIMQTAKSYNYGIYKVFIDGEYVATYDGYDPKVFVYNFSLGKHEVTAGEHVLRLELTGSNSGSIGTLISVASIIFGTERSMPDNPIYTQEVYDTDKVLGAKIFHTVNNSDIILHNRTTGKISAGGVTTTGEQAAIIGLMEDGYMEGFTVINGNSLVFNGKTLMKSTNKATVSADFRGKAKYAVTTEKAQSISLYVPYEVVGATVDGKSVKYSVDGNMAKVSVPAGTHTVALQVKNAVEYLWGDESGSGKALYDENGELTYKHWKDDDGTEYLYEDGQVKINAYFDEKTKLLVREELLEDGSWQITYYSAIGNVNKIEIEHTNGNLTTITYQIDGSISTLITDKRGDFLEMTMDYPDGSKTVAQYLDDKTVTTKYDADGNILSVVSMYNDGKRVEETYDENGKLLSTITRYKGGDWEETVYNADGSSVTSIYTANKLTGLKTVNADGTAVLEEYLENGSVRVTKYDKDGNVIEVTIDGKVVEEEKDSSWLWIVIAIGAVAVVGAAVLVIVLVKIKKRNTQQDAEEPASEE